MGRHVGRSTSANHSQEDRARNHISIFIDVLHRQFHERGTHWISTVVLFVIKHFSCALIVCPLILGLHFWSYPFDLGQDCKFYDLFFQGSSITSYEIDALPVRPLDRTFLWHSPKDDMNASDVKVTACRNSVQGKVLIVDDRGKIFKLNLKSNCCFRIWHSVQDLSIWWFYWKWFLSKNYYNY